MSSRPSDKLRQLLLADLERCGVGVRRYEQDKGLAPWSLRGITDRSRPQVPSIDRAAEICAALGVELCIGPQSVNGQPLSQIEPGEGDPPGGIVRVSDPRLAEILSELSRHFDLLNDPGREALLVRLASYFPDVMPHFRLNSRRPAAPEQP